MPVATTPNGNDRNPRRPHLAKMKPERQTFPSTKPPACWGARPLHPFLPTVVLIVPILIPLPLLPVCPEALCIIIIETLLWRHQLRPPPRWYPLGRLPELRRRHLRWRYLQRKPSLPEHRQPPPI